MRGQQALHSEFQVPSYRVRDLDKNKILYYYFSTIFFKNFIIGLGG